MPLVRRQEPSLREAGQPTDPDHHARKARKEGVTCQVPGDPRARRREGQGKRGFPAAGSNPCRRPSRAIEPPPAGRPASPAPHLCYASLTQLSSLSSTRLLQSHIKAAPAGKGGPAPAFRAGSELPRRPVRPKRQSVNVRADASGDRRIALHLGCDWTQSCFLALRGP